MAPAGLPTNTAWRWIQRDLRLHKLGKGEGYLSIYLIYVIIHGNTTELH